MWAKANEILTSDVMAGGGLQSWDIGYRVYETLVAVTDDGAIEPWLATSWEQPSDRSIIFHLRDGVRFSNGREMTADDVVTSLMRASNPETGGDFASRFADIASVTAVDALTVRVDLKQPSGVFLQSLAGINGSIYPGQELKDGSFDPTKELLGTGPFMVKDHKQDESWTLVRNPYYWRPDRPLPDELVIRILNDPAARVAALKGGTADIATFDSPDTASLFSGDANIVVVPQTTSDYYEIMINGNSPLEPKLADPRVRKALGIALDRRQIIDLALGGVGEALPGATTIPALADACDATQLPAEDVDEAKRLLNEAGALPMTVELLAYSTFPIMSSIAQVFQQQLQASGVTVNIESMETGALIDKVYVKGEFDMTVIFDTAFLDNWFPLAEDSPSTAAWRAGFTPATPGVDELLAQARQMEPGAPRAAIFQQICSKLAENSPSIPIATRSSFVAYRKDAVVPVLQSFEPNNNFLKNLAEFWRP